MGILIDMNAKPNTFVIYKDGEYLFEISKKNDISVVKEYFTHLGEKVEINKEDKKAC